MRIFGYKISISVKMKQREKYSRFKIDLNIQRKILGFNSQYQEDIFIDSIFRGKTRGTYIDIGANDPSEINNTKRFYDRGWSGINVEPNVAMYKKLCQERPRDINLNLGIGKQAGDLTFYELSPNTLSTFNKKSVLHSVKKEGAQIVSETTVKIMSLADLFDMTVSKKQVDFLSLDAEGYEHEILSSNNWQSYRPIAIVVELNQDRKGNVFNFIKKQGYILVHYNGCNGIFVDQCSQVIKSLLQD